MKDIHVELVNKLNAATKAIIKEYMSEKALDVRDLVYCSVYSAEETALSVKRALKLHDR